jgi:acyl carrier protein
MTRKQKQESIEVQNRERQEWPINNTKIADIEKEIADLMKEEIGVELDTQAKLLFSKFVEDLSFDSLDGISLVMEVEKRFGIEITDDETERINTGKDLAKVVREKLLRKRAVTKSADEKISKPKRAAKN